MTTRRYFRLRRRDHFDEPPEALTATSPIGTAANRVREARERANEARRRRQDQREHPQPDVRRRGPAGRGGGVLPQGQPGGEEPPRAVRRADQVTPAFRGRPRALELMNGRASTAR